MQMLQRHAMLKRLQELQRHQQPQGLGDGKEPNYLTQLPTIHKQSSGDQMLPSIDRTAIHDASQMLMVGNMNCGTAPAVQGFPNGFYSEPQNQDLHALSLVSQKLDVSLYGTPMADAKNNFSQYSHLQGLSHDSAYGVNKGSDNQAEKSVTQPSDFRSSFLNDHHNVSQDQLFMPGIALMSKQPIHGNNLFGQVPLLGFNCGAPPGNFQQMNTLQRNASVQEFSGRQEQTGWPNLIPEKTLIEPSQGLTTLDPLEQKILFNMDDNSWNASFGRNSATGTGDFGDMVEHTNCVSLFPSIQSGSWSALMQSAVAEASSSDNGLQEEWSGLSFQNTEPSINNQTSNFVDSGKQRTARVDNNVKSATTLSCKSKLLFNDSNLTSSFPGFQQSGIHFSVKQREGIESDSSPESVQQSPKHVANLDCNTQQNQSIEGIQPVHLMSPLGGTWHNQSSEQSEGDAHQQSMFAYNNTHRSISDMMSTRTESPLPSAKATLAVCDNGNAVNKSWMGDVKRSIYREKGHDICLSKVGQDSSKHVLEHHQFHYMRHANISAEDRSNVSKEDNHHHMVNSPQVSTNYHEATGETYKTPQRCYQRENSSDSYHSNASQHIITEHETRENIDTDCKPVIGGNQMSRGQVPQVWNSHEEGYFGQFKCVNSASRSDADFEKRNLEVSEEVGTTGANVSASFDTSVGIYGPNLTSRTRETMVELHQSLERATAQRTAMNLTRTDSTPLFKGNASAATTPGPSNLGIRPHSPAVPVATQSPQAILPGMAGRLPSLNCATSQGTSRPNSINPYGQQFQILDPVSVIQPSPVSGLHFSQQVGSSTRPPGVWTNVPTQPHLFSSEARKVPSNLLSFANSMEKSPLATSWATQEPHDQNTNTGTLSQEAGACLMNSQGFDPAEEHRLEERSQQLISSETLGRVSDTNRLDHGQEAVQNCLPPQDFGRAQQGGTQSPDVSARELEAFGLSLKPHNLHPSYSLLHQVHSMKNLKVDPSKRVLEKNQRSGSDLNVHQVATVAGDRMMYGHNSGVRDPENNVSNVASLLSSFSTRDVKMLSFLSEKGEGQSVKASFLPFLQDTTREMVTPQNCTQSHPICDKTALNGTECSQINLQMAPSWFKHYGTLGNGQVLPMYDPRTGKNSGHQFLPATPPENLQMIASAPHVRAADAIQLSSFWPTAAVPEGKQLAPCVLPLNVSDQNLTVTRLKKRKVGQSDILPWHQEVAQSSKRLQTMSTAELVWAHATNRRIEKVEAEPEMIEDMPPLLRSKKRLGLTTQLMQQVFRPPPAAIVLADATSHYDSVAYFTAKLALGDACCLTACKKSDSCLPSNTCDKIYEERRTSERTGDQQYSGILEDFTKRAKKLESDLLRLIKTPSFVDIRVECRELEKFSVINRFARFHCRGPPDAAGASSSSNTTPTASKPFPQRYVTANPMPRAVPEGAKYLSL